MGRAILTDGLDTPSGVGISISEAVDMATTRDDTNYALRSVLNDVLMHQTVIGLEVIAQMEMADDYPEVLVECTGGSNISGLVFPFLGGAASWRRAVKVVACESAACPTLTQGRYAYNFGDTATLAPLVKMHTLGLGFVLPDFHAGGLSYHRIVPLVSYAQEFGLIESRTL